MNKLQLVQRLSREAGINFTGPSDTAGQIGEYGRCVDWIDDAWNEIELEKKWRWQWEATTITVTTGNHTASNDVSVNRWLTDLTYNGDNRLEYLPWEQFCIQYRDSQLGDGDPVAWTIKPDMTFAISSKVTANTDFSIQRFKNPTALADKDASPLMPSAYHMAIVWLAMLRYCNFEEAGVSRATAQHEYARIHGKLCEDQAYETYYFAEPLA